MAPTQENEKRGDSLDEFEIEKLSQTSGEEGAQLVVETPAISYEEMGGAKTGAKKDKEDDTQIELEGDGQTRMIDGYPHKQNKGGQRRKTDNYGNL